MGIEQRKLSRSGGKLPRKRKSNFKKQLHPSVYQSDRWVVTAEGELPKVLLSEGRAESIANGIALAKRVTVEIEHQRRNEAGEWVPVETE